MKILIFGGAGFVGNTLARYFESYGHEIHVVDNLVRRGVENNLPYFRKKNIKFMHGDIRCVEDFTQLDDSYDVVLECSAQPSACAGYANPAFDFSTNTGGLFNVLEFCRKTDSPLIFWSTNKAYSGDRINKILRKEEETRWVWDTAMFPVTSYEMGYSANGINENMSPDGGEHSIYGASKISADLWVQEYSNAFGLKTVVNRFSCLAGPYQWGMAEQGWVAWFAVANILGLPIEYIGWLGKQVRDVLFSEDLCNLIRLEIEKLPEISGEVFIVGGGNSCNTSLLECVDQIEKITGKKTTTSYNPTIRKADHCVYISDITKAKKVLGWEPNVTMENGLNEIVMWVQDNIEILESMYKRKTTNA